MRGVQQGIKRVAAIAVVPQVYTETIGTFGTASLWEHAVDLLAHMRADGHLGEGVWSEERN